MVAFERLWNVLLVLYSLYFLQQEWRQFKKQKCSYFLDVWNWSDYGPPVIIILIIIVDFFCKKEWEHPGLASFRYSMQAFASFGMWVKIFYFLRIFRQTGFFVNMLLKVIKSSRTFFLLYILILCAFSCSFYIMDPQEDQGIIHQLNYSYLLGLGEFDMEWSNFRVPITMQFFFLLATLLVLIVMLNLLIAIISTAYEDVISTQQEANDFERVNLIADTSQFIKSEKTPCKPNEYLIKAQLINFSEKENEEKEM